MFMKLKQNRTAHPTLFCAFQKHGILRWPQPAGLCDPQTDPLSVFPFYHAMNTPAPKPARSLSLTSAENRNRLSHKKP